jgi:hypothetical protein
VVGALAKGKRYGKEFPFRTDLHWNYTGAYYTAEAMVNAINEREGKPAIRFDGRFVKAGEVVGGDSLSLGLLWPVKEALLDSGRCPLRARVQRRTAKRQGRLVLRKRRRM